MSLKRCFLQEIGNSLKLQGSSFQTNLEHKRGSIQSVIEPSAQPDIDWDPEGEEDCQDAMEIDDDPVVISREAICMLDKLQVFVQNDPDLSREVSHLTKRVEQMTDLIIKYFKIIWSRRVKHSLLNSCPSV